MATLFCPFCEEEVVVVPCHCCPNLPRILFSENDKGTPERKRVEELLLKFNDEQLDVYLSMGCPRMVENVEAGPPMVENVEAGPPMVENVEAGPPIAENVEAANHAINEAALAEFALLFGQALRERRAERRLEAVNNNNNINAIPEEEHLWFAFGPSLFWIELLNAILRALFIVHLRATIFLSCCFIVALTYYIVFFR